MTLKKKNKKKDKKKDIMMMMRVFKNVSKNKEDVFSILTSKNCQNGRQLYLLMMRRHSCPQKDDDEN